MEITVFTGRMPLEELNRDKPREYEAVVASGKLEAQMEAAYPPIVTRTIRAFAWVALALGFNIVLWILICGVVRVPVELVCFCIERRVRKCLRLGLLSLM
jgi:hypothetical protein